MKKKIIAIVVVVMVVCIAVAAVFVVKNKSTNISNEESGNTATLQKTITVEDWFRVTTVSELESYAKASKKEITFENEYAYISDMIFADGAADYSYRFDENKNIDRLSIAYEIVPSTQTDEKYVMESVTEDELKTRIENTMLFVSDVLGTSIGDKFYIISGTGNILSNGETSSYREILNGTAYLETRILDVDGSVWVFEISKMPAYDMIFCTLEHYAPDSEQAKFPCYISVAE